MDKITQPISQEIQATLGTIENQFEAMRAEADPLVRRGCVATTIT